MALYQLHGTVQNQRTNMRLLPRNGSSVGCEPASRRPGRDHRASRGDIISNRWQAFAAEIRAGVGGGFSTALSTWRSVTKRFVEPRASQVAALSSRTRSTAGRRGAAGAPTSSGSPAAGNRRAEPQRFAQPSGHARADPARAPRFHDVGRLRVRRLSTNLATGPLQRAVSSGRRSAQLLLAATDRGDLRALHVPGGQRQVGQIYCVGVLSSIRSSTSAVVPNFR